MFRGLGLRIVLIAAVALFLVQVTAGIGLILQRRADTGTDARAPLADQVAAMVELLDRAPEEELPRLLRSFNSGSMRVALLDTNPGDGGGAWVRAPIVARQLRTYLAEEGQLTVSAEAHWSLSQDDWDRAMNDPGGFLQRWPMRFVIQLTDGRYTVIETNIDVLSRALGVRFAPGLVILTLLVTVLALVLIRRELKPFEALTQHLRTSAEQGRIDPLPETGTTEARRLITAFNAMQARIRTLIDARSQLMAGVAHDFGTYLTRLRLRIAYIADEAQREKAAADIEEMRAIIADTTTFASLQSEVPPDETADLAEIVEAAAERLGHETLAIAVPPLAPVRGTASRLMRAVLNVMQNAAVHAGGAEVRIVPGPDWTVLLVEDRGPGISAGERALALQPFYRADKSRTRATGGSGLGLAIANEAVRSCRGELVLEDREGGGLRVRIRLRTAGAPDGVQGA